MSIPAPIRDYEVRPNGSRKINFRGNSSSTIGANGDLGVNVGLLRSDTRIPGVWTGGDPFEYASFGPGCKCITNGYWYNSGRPGDAFSLKNNEHTYHYITSMNRHWRVTNAVSFRGNVGGDYSDVYIHNLQKAGEV